MKFLFSTFDNDSDYKNIRKAEHIIQQYDVENKISDLSQDQKTRSTQFSLFMIESMLSY